MSDTEKQLLEILRLQHMAISALASVICGNYSASGTVVGTLLSSQEILKKYAMQTPNADPYLEGYLVDTSKRIYGLK